MHGSTLPLTTSGSTVLCSLRRHAFRYVTTDVAWASAGVDSFGVKIMKERADRIGAGLNFTSPSRNAQRVGTCVTISVGELKAPERRPSNSEIDCPDE